MIRLRNQDPDVWAHATAPSPRVVIGTANATQGARDTLLLVLADVPVDRLDAFIEDYARSRLAPVIAAKIVAQGGNPERGDAALVIARTMLEDAAGRLREGGLQSGRA